MQEKTLCPACKEREANISSYYGILPCKVCSDRQSKFQKPNRSIEFTSESIKKQRKDMGQDTWPMHRKGELSKEFVDKYGAKKALQRGFTKEEIRKAKNVWRGTETYYK